MPGYFKVPMNAARALVNEFDGPQLLAGYVVLREGAYPEKRGDNRRGLTASGAKAIRVNTGCTDFRSKKVMTDLLSLRFGERGQFGLLTATDRKLKNAPVYILDDWEQSADAYLPSIFVKSGNKELGGALRRLCNLEQPEHVKRDALLLLLYLYANVDYAGWLGAPPDVFAYQVWDIEGERDVGDDGIPFELGNVGGIDAYDMWLCAPPINETWHMPKPMEALIGKDRAWEALWLLLNEAFVCKVAVVTDTSLNYPLWVFSPSYRETLRSQHRIVADLADPMHRLACDIGADPDNYLIRQTTGSELGPEGTGLFFCAAKSQPLIRTILMPRLDAPTFQNKDGFSEMSLVTRKWAERIQSLRRASKAA